MTTTSARVTYDDLIFGRSLIAHSAAIAHWRRTAAEVIRRWDASDSAVHLVQLGVTELLSNVARHVDDPRCYLRIARIGSKVEVQVFDRSRELPRFNEAPDCQAESGRGLQMVREMASGFGIELTDRRRGKIVWFSCDLT
ncbi:ATP-binding protein [Streptomyces sp. NPDC049881]|uniref:ATP-binding protein n=1 Tax=Streptomyces sp. NPDC049881 TaxID=3155778 RepID=UPI003440BE0A